MYSTVVINQFSSAIAKVSIFRRDTSNFTLMEFFLKFNYFTNLKLFKNLRDNSYFLMMNSGSTSVSK